MEKLLITANALFSINDAGLKAKFIPVIGFGRTSRASSLHPRRRARPPQRRLAWHALDRGRLSSISFPHTELAAASCVPDVIGISIRIGECGPHGHHVTRSFPKSAID